MTQTFDYAAVVDQEPTHWQTSRLHWHCYLWTGTGAEWADDAARKDPSSALPPTAVRAWLQKPAKLLKQVAGTPDEAQEWLREQATPLVERELYPQEIDWEWRYRHSLYDLRSGNDLVWGIWTKGPSISALAVIGTSERCHQV
ncbi:hypothetical protein [Spirillospora sp. CA-294931]|uniref:hypothetical protein n=1 Tax=Spirillospora sp. CA-294931 TaxID=3240042 RepID=UPI003D8BD084